MTSALQAQPPSARRAPPDIVLEPALDSEHAADVMHRLAWYAAPLLARGATIHAELDDAVQIDAVLSRPDSLAEDAHARVAGHLDQLNFAAPGRSRPPRGAVRVVWDGVHAARLGLVTHGRVIVADDRTDPHAVDAWMRLALIDAPERHAQAAERLSRLAERIGAPRDALLVGPGRVDPDQARFDAELRIACNAVVCDDALWRRARPHVLTFADPWAHAGPSRAAGEFRRRVFDALSGDPVFLVTPERCAALIEAAAPAHLRDRVIAVQESDDAALLGDVGVGVLRVRPTGNVLTALMMPLAAWSGAGEIEAIGFDAVRARATGWRHARHRAALETHVAAAEAHPANAPAPFAGYAARHLARTQRLAAALRDRGVAVRLPESYARPAAEENTAMRSRAAILMRRERLLSFALLAAGVSFALAGAILLGVRHGLGFAMAALAPALLIGFVWLDTRRRARIFAAELASRLSRRQARRDALVEARLSKPADADHP